MLPSLSGRRMKPTHIMPGSRSIWSGWPGSSGSDRERRDLDLGVGAVELRAGLEERRRCRTRASPAARAGSSGTAPLAAGLGAEQLVVAEVLREPELQHEHAVLAQPGADVRAVHHDVDAGGPQRVRGADAGELEDLGRGDGARREDHLASGAGLDAAAPPARRPPGSPSSSTRSTTVFSATVRLGRSMTGCRNASAALTRRPSRIVAIA